MNIRKKHKQLGEERINLKKEMKCLYDKTKVKVCPGDVVESLDFGHGRTFMYFVFLDSWQNKLCYVQINNGGSVSYSQVDNGYIHGTLVCKNGYGFALAKLLTENASDIVIKSFKQMVYEPKICDCPHQRFCVWCGKRLTVDMAS